MDPNEIKQRLTHWSRQTIVFAILLQEHFDGNPFASPVRIQETSDRAKVIVEELWQEALRECAPDRLAMHFIGKVLAWGRDGQEDLSVTHSSEVG